MEWIDHAIWWQVYPLGFCGAPFREEDPAPAPRMRKLLAWLDYAIELGASGLLLGPVFASQTHGYDTTDQFRIDPRLGGEETFEALVSACKKRGLRILLDGVFSHVGAQHPGVVRALQEGKEDPAAELFDIDWTSGRPVPRVFEGHSSLVRLNHAGEQAADYTVAVMKHWLERGIDGWRLDAAYSISPDFWPRVLPVVRADYPDAWFLGEVIHGDYSKFVAESSVDSVTQYELWKAIWSSIRDRNLFELDWALKRHNEFLANFTPHTFVGNHDVTRIASVIGADGAVSAVAILLTLGGVPSIYYGDEQGFIGIKEECLGGDDAIRPGMPDDPSLLAPWGENIYRAHQELIGLRRRHPWLVTAASEMSELDNTRCVYRAISKDRVHQLTVEISLVNKPAVVILDAAGQVLWQQY